MGIRNMQGTPAILERLRPNDGVKRSRYRCLEYNSETKNCRYTGKPCHNVSHCDRYHETKYNNKSKEFRIAKGKKVCHSEYGEGTIIAVKNKKTISKITFTVEFDVKQFKEFVIPDDLKDKKLVIKD